MSSAFTHRNFTAKRNRYQGGRSFINHSALFSARTENVREFVESLLGEFCRS
jgi:hypothetical protein